MKQAGHVLINGHYRQQPSAGVHRYANEIVEQFNRRGLSYDWVQPPRSIQTDSLRQLWIQSVMPWQVPKGKVLWSPTNIGPVWSENQVLTLHDIADQIHPEWFDNMYVQWRRLILPGLLKRVRRVITVSHFSKQSILSRFPDVEGKIEVVYNGVRHDHFYPRSRGEIEQLRKSLGLHKPFILSVGSLDTRKNVHGLIRAWQMLPQQVRDTFDLVITGESGRKFAFEFDPEYDASINFTGYVKDAQLPVLYTAATIFAYPSLFEGFGLPVLEAMACGTPVVTSDTTSLKELAGDKAVTVNPHEPEAIAGALERLLASESMRERYGGEGHEYAQRFTWKRAADETQVVLESAVP